MVKITVDVDSETFYKLKRVAESRGITVYALVKEILKAFVLSSSGFAVKASVASNVSSGLDSDPDPPAQDRLANILKQIVDRVKDIDERVSIIERMHWGVDHINKVVQVYEGEESEKILEEIRKGLNPIERSEGSRITVEVYES